MASLTGTKIKDTYPGLLKTVDNAVVGATEKQITDGEGNAIPISMGTSGVSFTGDADFTGATVTGLPGGIEGTNYLFVAADGTDIENAAQLQAAYNTAKTLTPSATNRITIIAAPGNYNFEANEFTMDTQYIDLVSLDGNRSVVFNSADTNGKINVTANDVFIKGLDMQTKAFTIATNLSLLRVENCIAGNESFGGSNIIASGTFIDCVGASNSFGSLAAASGVFINCEASGTRSFGGLADASGIFTNCIATGNQHFGAFVAASGTFTDCVGLGQSFGYGGVASGTFTNCIGGVGALAGDGTASGTFINCEAPGLSFGGNGTASGTFTNCKGGENAFGGGTGALTGQVYRCQLTTGTFQTPTGTGKIVLGIDGNDDVINLTA